MMRSIPPSVFTKCSQTASEVMLAAGFKLLRLSKTMAMAMCLFLPTGLRPRRLPKSEDSISGVHRTAEADAEEESFEDEDVFDLLTAILREKDERKAV